jgi:hypothetical protein
LCYIIDYPVSGVKSPFGYSPLLYYNHWPVSKFRDPRMKLLLANNIALSFEDIEHKETYVPDLSGQSGRYTKCRILISEEGFIALI